MTNDEIKHRILNVYAKFVSDVEPVRLSDYLVEGGVISIEEWERISQKNLTSPDKCRALLNHLFSTQHPEAFLIVRKALSERNHYLLKYIDNQESGCGLRVQPDGESSSQDKWKIEQLEKDKESQKRALEEQKDRLLKTQKELETKLKLEEGDLQSKRGSEQSPIAEQSNEIDLLRKENRKLKQELEATKSAVSEKLYQERKLWFKEKEQLVKQIQVPQHSLDKNRIQLEKDNDDQKKAWDAEKDRLLKTQKEHEDQKKAWEAENYRLLKMQEEQSGQKRSLEAEKDRLLKTQNEHEGQKRALEAENDRLLKTQKEHEDQKRAWNAEKDRLLKTQKELETKLNLDKKKMEQLETDNEDNSRSWQEERDRLLKMQQELETKVNPETLRYNSDPILVSRVRTKAAENERKAIVGLTILNKELFIVNGESSEIEVYDSSNFCFSRRWNLKELIYPWDIGSAISL